MSAKVRGGFPKVVDGVCADESVILCPSVVVDIEFFVERKVGIDVDFVHFCLLVIVSVAVDLGALRVGLNVLPLLVDKLKNLY